MKTHFTTILAILALTVAGCELPQIVRPLRLYDLDGGKTIEVFLQNSSRNSGRLVSAREADEQFEGEIGLYGGYTATYRPLPGTSETRAYSDAAHKPPDSLSLAELYGFGKGTNVRPSGTGILVGNRGTVIEIVIYGLTPDALYGDGVAVDNKGGRYRVFLSVEQ